MKKYKLKHDIPGYKAGTMLEMRSSGLYELGGLIAYDAGQLRAHPDIMDWFEEVGERWEPEDGSYYWFANTDGTTSHANWINCASDRSHLALGNCFRTKEEAEAHLKWLKAVAVLRADIANQRPDWLGWKDVFMVRYSHKTKELFAAVIESVQSAPFVFDNMDDAKRSIAEHMSEWLTFLGVE